MIGILQSIKLFKTTLRNLPVGGRIYHFNLHGLFTTTSITVAAAVLIGKKAMDKKERNTVVEGCEVNGACAAAIQTTKSVFKNNRFYNPFDTWTDPGLMTLIKWKMWHKDHTNLPGKQEELDDKLPVLKPTFVENPPGLVVTWLGHATTLVQLDGVNVLTDPVFSAQCGPIQNSWVAHKRFRPAPCAVDDLPQIHAVVISHSHYDHLDVQSVKDLNRRFRDSLHWFVPLKLKSWFKSLDCQNVHELDWWEEKALPGHQDIKLVFTPAQHWSARTMVDQYQTLWGSWCVIGPQHKFYFAGDTGYCEAFRQIGQKYGPFDLAAIPIGAYLPRDIMSPQHVDPSQAVDIHRDIKAIKSVGIHWGTFAMANEFYLQPPQDLAKALEKKGVREEDFFVLQHGESKTMDSTPTCPMGDDDDDTEPAKL